MRLAPRVPLTRLALELDRPAAPRARDERVLELCAAAVAEPRAHPEEVLPGVVALDGRAEAEEGVVLDGALPEVLARLLVAQPEEEGVLLLVALVVVLDHHQGELLLLEVELGDLGPEEEADLGLPLEDEDAGGGEAERVLGTVLAQHRVHVDAVHFQRLGLVQEGRLRLRRTHSPGNDAYIRIHYAANRVQGGAGGLAAGLG